MPSERKTLEVFHARLKRMRQLVNLGELNNDVDITGRGSMRVVTSRVAISYGVELQDLGQPKSTCHM
jgi:hypothetical protein